MASINLQLGNIPAELKARPQWVCWKLGQRDEKATKLPYNPRTGGLADSTNPETWGTIQEALIACETYRANGVGFVFSERDRYTGIDFDKCRDPETGKIEAWAKDQIDRFNSYTEISPSETGLHTIVIGQVPSGGHRKGKIELYDKARYFTFTGNVLNGCSAIVDCQAQLRVFHREIFGAQAEETADKPSSMPVELLGLDDGELLSRAQNADDGGKFSKLWTGDWAGAGYPSQSEADQALCNKLAFWCGRARARMNCLFRRSGLYRSKWDRPDYSGKTLDRAIELCKEVYKPPRPKAESGISECPPVDFPEGYTKEPPEKNGATPEQTRLLQAKKNPLNLPPMPEVFTAATLEAMTFPEPVWIVPGLIPEGVTLLAGKPKIGKSYAVMNIGLALACGGKALGAVEVEKRGVLYLCLEDRQRRLQNRISALFYGDNWPKNFHFAITWPRIDQGGIPLLQKWLEDHSDVKLVIVDTLAKVKSRKVTNKQMYDLDYQCIEALKSVADMMDVSLIVVHHLRKMLADDDAFDAISGSTGLTGAADTCVVLRKDRKGRPLLYIRGRDVEEAELALERDPSGGWTLLGDAAVLAKTQERRDVLGAMEEGEAVTIGQLAKLTGKKAPNIHALLKHLIDDEQVRQTAYGKYIKCVSGESGESGESDESGESGESRRGAGNVLSPPLPEDSPPLPEDSPPLVKVNSATTKGLEGTFTTFTTFTRAIICSDCESFEQNPHKPNKQGRCRGTPWDDDTDQWPQLKHECGAFKRTASQEGK